jgi:flagellar assembly protein FliH
MGSKIIDKTSGATVDRWDFPAVDDSAAQELKGARASGAHLLTARQVDALQAQAHEEAYRRGYEEGLQAGNTEVAARVTRLDRLAGALARPLQDLDHTVERELLELAAALARQILHRELENDPAHITRAVRDCLEVLPSAAREVTLHLHPSDAIVVRDQLSSDAERPWRIEEDAALEPGSLRVSSDSSQIDGRLQTRLREMIASALDGQPDREGIR